MKFWKPECNLLDIYTIHYTLYFLYIYITISEEETVDIASQWNKRHCYGKPTDHVEKTNDMDCPFTHIEQNRKSQLCRDLLSYLCPENSFF